MSTDTAAHYEWRKRVGNELPAASARVFALRGKHYAGCGFHYGLERCLGKVLMLVNDYENPITEAGKITDEIIVENFYRDLLEAEQSAIALTSCLGKD